jgi:thiamine pyrophosphate-dependent acetolactate synthase large subunit-like protein
MNPDARPVRPIPVYEMLAQEIRGLGIDRAFGLISDDTAALVATLDALGVRFFGARHETSAIAMAEGYADASGRLGIAIIGRGPATANGLNGAIFASRTGSPVLAIFGDAPRGAARANGIGPDYKSLDAERILAAAGLRVFVPSSAANAASALHDAIAAVERGQPAALLVPTDIQQAKIDLDDRARSPLRAPDDTLRPRPQSIAAVLPILASARRPLIIAGRGAHKSGAKLALERLAGATGALLATTTKAKDMFRGHPWNLGIVGSFAHAPARQLIDQADCVLVFGAGLNFLTTGFGRALPQVPVIHVDNTRANIGRWHPADVAIVADARVAAEEIAARLPARAPSDMPFHGAAVREMLARLDLRCEFESAATPQTLDPRELALALDRMLPGNRAVVYDAGNFLGVVPYIAVPGPDHFKMTSEFSSIGLGIGTALGFASARPGATTVLIIGDGGLLMTLGELETLVRENLPLVVVVMNDGAYGAEVHYLRLSQLPTAKAEFRDVDFVAIARGIGLQAATVRRLDELEAIAADLADPKGPMLIDCKINPSVAAPFMAAVAPSRAPERARTP